MNSEDSKSLALKYCIDIAQHYSESEVMKYAPKPVQLAWKIGKDFMSLELEKDRKKFKDFKL